MGELAELAFFEMLFLNQLAISGATALRARGMERGVWWAETLQLTPLRSTPPHPKKERVFFPLKKEEPFFGVLERGVFEFFGRFEPFYYIFCRAQKIRRGLWPQGV